ncbi:MAG: substrate-binding domain-containing protein [Candidatus Bathyarchaeota archaeon]|nr:substrate-binding domain-containing protein [Candidatus Bathyarchaeota archaeon]
MTPIKKSIVAIALIALMAFAMVGPVQALLTSHELVTRGSSTVYPVSMAAKTAFMNHYPAITSVEVNSGGSGGAFPGVYQVDTPYSDVGSMSRLPKSTEWALSGADNAQIWSIGIDSIAILIGPGNNWLKTDLTTQEVADIYCGGYTNWDDLPAGYLVGTAPATPIDRVVRDLESGTTDCFYNFFLDPEDLELTDITTPFTELPNNIDVYNHMTTGATKDYSIAFIGMGFLHLGGLYPINIYNAAEGEYYEPTEANVLAGLYTPIRNLWHLTDGIPAVGSEDAAQSVWISFMKLPNATNPDYQGDYAYVEDLCEENFVSGEGYMNMLRDDFTSDISTGNGARPGQTQYIPDNAISPLDLYYFAGNYGSSLLNPYVDMNADGQYSPTDTYIFARNYK